MKRGRKRDVTIYTLSCPIIGDIRYVGATSKPLKTRLNGHVKDCQKYNTKRAKWVLSILNDGLMPIIEPLEETKDNWELAEMFWISQLRAWGFDLTNVTDGGIGQLGNSMNKGKRDEHRFRPVDQYSKNGDYIATYPCMKDAAIANGIWLTSIRACLMGRYKYAGGFIWKDSKIKTNG